ncbi:MAG: hypothetical protein M3N93_15145 [Acidobacteriota bacterium]|nr:hypothetical protein [Acidobacteriota bacterium]
MLLSIFRWADQTWISTLIRNSTWVFALIEVFHLFGITLLLGTLIVINLRLFGFGLTGQSLKVVAADTLPFTFTGMVLTFSTGLLLFVAEPMKLYGSVPFFVKMGLLATALLFTFTFNRYLTARDAPPSLTSKCAACLSIALWFSVGLAGRAIAFF